MLIGSYYFYNKRNSVCFAEPRPSNTDQPIEGAGLTFDLAPRMPYPLVVRITQCMRRYSVQLWKQMSLRERPKYSASDSNLDTNSFKSWLESWQRLNLGQRVEIAIGFDQIVHKKQQLI